MYAVVAVIDTAVAALAAAALWARIEKKTQKNSYLIIYCTTSEGESKVSDGANE